MSDRRAKVSQADIARVLKGARDAGVPVARFEVGSDGSVKVYAIADTCGETVNDWDRP
jgi:hypothetical protein